jgi:hypothetical protein
LVALKEEEEDTNHLKVVRIGSSNTRPMYLDLLEWPAPSYHISEHERLAPLFSLDLPQLGEEYPRWLHTVARSQHCEVPPTVQHYLQSANRSTGAVETLGLETKPLGIRTLLVEPGFFRTELLNANNTVYVDTKIDDYKPLTESLFATFKGYNQKQPGDPAKGVQRIIDTVKGENDAAGKEFPASLALGSDAVEQLRNKCKETLKLLDEWEAVSSNTNYD